MSIDTAIVNRLVSLEQQFNDFISQDKPYIGPITSGYVAFGNINSILTGDSNLFWDNTNKRLGIGTIAPDLSLDIENNNTAFTGIELTNTDTSIKRWAVAANSNGTTYGPSKGFIIRDISAGGSRLVIDTDGNTGIGLITPQATLDVARGTANQTAMIRGTNHITYFHNSTTEDIYLRAGKSGGTILLNDTHNGKISIGVGGGNVGIGTSAPTRKLSLDNGGNCYLSFNVSGSEKWVFGVEPATSNRLILYNSTLGFYSMIFHNATGYVSFGNHGAASYAIELQNTASAIGQARANAWNTYSSQTRKRNIRAVDMPTLRQRAQQLKIVNFQWNDTPANSRTEIGLIAEDVMPIFPEIVNGDINDPETLGIAESKAGIIALALVLDLMKGDQPNGNPTTTRGSN